MVALVFAVLMVGILAGAWYSAPLLQSAMASERVPAFFKRFFFTSIIANVLMQTIIRVLQ